MWDFILYGVGGFCFGWMFNGAKRRALTNMGEDEAKEQVQTIKTKLSKVESRVKNIEGEHAGYDVLLDAFHCMQMGKTRRWYHAKTCDVAMRRFGKYMILTMANPNQMTDEVKAFLQQNEKLP